MVRAIRTLVGFVLASFVLALSASAQTPRLGPAVAVGSDVPTVAPMDLPAPRSLEVDALRGMVERQQKQIEELQRRLSGLEGGGRKGGDRPGIGPIKDVPPQPENEKRPGDGIAGAGDRQPTGPPLDEAGVKKVVGDYLRANPGIGLPPSVQTGFEAGRGFVIRSFPNPTFPRSEDECPIPFELRFRGRAQMAYVYYNVNDNFNHLTKQSYDPPAGDLSQIEAKRVRLLWEGTLFSPYLRYQFQLDGNTRGFGVFQNNRVVQGGSLNTPAASYGAPGIGGAPSPIGGGVAADHAIRLFTAWVAYDIPLADFSRGCGPDCPAGTAPYSPVLTFVIGKQQPFFGLTEIIGSANAQFAEFSMADWFFDSDDNNMLNAVSVQYRDFHDRLFMTAQVTNGSESGFPNTLMDAMPGFISGFWYDLGGSWDAQHKRWNLFGASISDLNYSLKPTARIGGAMNLVPLARRGIFGDLEASRYYVTPGGPGGTRLINLLSGAPGAPLGSHDVDKFESYSYDVFGALHYRGFSLYNEWWFRNLNNFRTNPVGNNVILYQDGTGATALFPTGRGLFDFGTTVQAGFFLVPKKFELIARFSHVRGNSGAIFGDGTFTTTTVPGVKGPVRVYDRAFRRYHGASEYAAGFNYFIYGQLVKWTTDMSLYQGGNPAGGGASPTSFIPGVDGWLLRTQLQVAF